MCLKDNVHKAFDEELIRALRSERGKAERDAVLDALKALEPKIMSLVDKANVRQACRTELPSLLCPAKEEDALGPKEPEYPPRFLGLTYIKECQALGAAKLFPSVFAALLGYRSAYIFYRMLREGDRRFKGMKLNLRTGEVKEISTGRTTRTTYPWTIFIEADDKAVEAVLRENGRLPGVPSGRFRQEAVVPSVLRDVVKYAENPTPEPIWATDSRYVCKLVNKE